MAAPTPVSAYLHSATMVKAGVYLLARTSPILSGTEGWFYLVTGFGMVTMVLAAYIAWQQLDLKRILAYSTVSALGTLVMLLGLGTETAISAAIIFLLVHSLYKGALFMVAGAIDHETGIRSVAKLGGLRRAMPITATAAVLAALSMAGIPPFIGFISKELMYEAALHAEVAAMIYLLVSAEVLANALMIVAAALVAAKPFFGPRIETPKHAHEAPLTMWVGPVILAGLGLLVGLSQVIAAVTPIHVDQLILTPAVRSILAEAAEVHLVLWHGLNTALALSIVTLILGIAFYSRVNVVRRQFEPLNMIAKWGPEKWYLWLMDGLMVVARVQTRLLQSGYLRYYLTITILTTVGIAGYTLVSRGGQAASDFIRPPQSSIYEMIIYLVILVAALVVISTSSRLTAVAGLGVVGYGVSLIFILFGAPDLAMTQFSIETLSVILLVLVLYKLPRFTRFSKAASRAQDFVVALAGGGLMALLVLIVTALPAQSRLTPYFAENSYLLAQGHNVVNVILVDFRGFDTMGEITVLGVAALGVFSLLYLRLDRSKSSGLQQKPEAVETETPKPQPAIEQYER
jgi:multicomponent Na+:H+ antiporter subunit A